MVTILRLGLIDYSGKPREIDHQGAPIARSTNMSTCGEGNDFDGRLGIRISAIFVIGLGSFLGTWFPVFAARHKGVGVPPWAFFIAKYFGSGVIVATAFIHVSITPVLAVVN